MERIPKGWLAVGVLVVLTCGVMLWQGISTSYTPAELQLAQPGQDLSAPSDNTIQSPEQSAPSAEKSEIVVHVAGAVKKPGVVRVPRGSRVDDAVMAAGGFSSQADPDSVNLAQPLEDGVQVYVPRKGESVVVEGRVGAVEPTPAPARARSEGSTGRININTATAEQLESLPGIGPVTARAIVEYRRQNGGFHSVEELLEVRGIGEKRLEQIRSFVMVR
ncbi:MAG: helix-hairpin-helix domain-containing protein [Armatimonadota bacterium]|jgi:competence protein ComEA